jgi:hypothetical protein
MAGGSFGVGAPKRPWARPCRPGGTGCFRLSLSEHEGEAQHTCWACLAKVGIMGVYSRSDGQARLPSQGGKPQGGAGTLPAPGPGGGSTHPQGPAGPPLALRPRPLPGPAALPRLLPPHLPQDGGPASGPHGGPLPLPSVLGPLRGAAPGPPAPGGPPGEAFPGAGGPPLLKG